MKKVSALLVFCFIGGHVLATDLTSELQIVGSVYQNQQGENVFIAKTKEDIQMCLDICIQTFEQPGAELKACVTKCAN